MISEMMRGERGPQPINLASAIGDARNNFAGVRGVLTNPDKGWHGAMMRDGLLHAKTFQEYIEWKNTSGPGHGHVDNPDNIRAILQATDPVFIAEHDRFASQINEALNAYVRAADGAESAQKREEVIALADAGLNLMAGYLQTLKGGI